MTGLSEREKKKNKHHPPFHTFQLSEEEEPHLDKPHPSIPAPSHQDPSASQQSSVHHLAPFVPSLPQSSLQRMGLTLLCKATLDVYRKQKKPFILYSWFKKRKPTALFYFFVLFEEKKHKDRPNIPV